MLTCPLCGREMDAAGPGVAPHREDYDPKHGPSGDWVSSWVPFIEDLRGSPQRLVHPECFAAEAGLPALVALIHERDKMRRLQDYEHWKRRHGIQSSDHRGAPHGMAGRPASLLPARLLFPAA